MVVEVQKEDIKLIGHTVYNCNGNTAIICFTTYNHREYILLRNILKCFGDEYRIIESYERFENPNDLRTVTDRVYITNLPFETYISTDFPFDFPTV